MVTLCLARIRSSFRDGPEFLARRAAGVSQNHEIIARVLSVQTHLRAGVSAIRQYSLQSLVYCGYMMIHAEVHMRRLQLLFGIFSLVGILAVGQFVYQSESAENASHETRSSVYEAVKSVKTHASVTSNPAGETKANTNHTAITSVATASQSPVASPNSSQANTSVPSEATPVTTAQPVLAPLPEIMPACLEVSGRNLCPQPIPAPEPCTCSSGHSCSNENMNCPKPAPVVPVKPIDPCSCPPGRYCLQSSSQVVCPLRNTQ